MTKYEAFLEVLKNYKGSDPKVKGLYNLLTTEIVITAEDIRALNNIKQYLTKKELLDLIDKELTKPDYREADMEIVNICLESLDKGLYYETLEEAESHYDDI